MDKIKQLIERLHRLDPRVKFIVGIACILIGLLALVTPLTPGAWLIFVGLELVGLRIIPWRRFFHWLNGTSETDTLSDTDSRNTHTF